MGKILIRSSTGYGTWDAYGDVTVSSSASLTLEYGTDYFFSGTTATWTLPAISATSVGRTKMITIKNRGTGNLTINTNASANVLFSTSLTNTITLASGEAINIMPDGTYLNVE